MESSDSAQLQSQHRADQFLYDFIDGVRNYHNHKENMAHAGIAAWVVGTSSVLAANDWPPSWISEGEIVTQVLTSVGVTVLWFIMLYLLKWQLDLRYWAAVHVAATQQVLSQWITNPPTEHLLKPWAPESSDKDSGICKCDRIFYWIAQWVWPSKQIMIRSDVNDRYYPEALVRAWIEQRREGSGAVNHSRVIVISGWLFYVVLIARTWIGDP